MIWLIRIGMLLSNIEEDIRTIEGREGALLSNGEDDDPLGNTISFEPPSPISPPIRQPPPISSSSSIATSCPPPPPSTSQDLSID